MSQRNSVASQPTGGSKSSLSEQRQQHLYQNQTIGNPEPEVVGPVKSQATTNTESGSRSSGLATGCSVAAGATDQTKSSATCRLGSIEILNENKQRQLQYKQQEPFKEHLERRHRHQIEQLRGERLGASGQPEPDPDLRLTYNVDTGAPEFMVAAVASTGTSESSTTTSGPKMSAPGVDRKQTNPFNSNPAAGKEKATNQDKPRPGQIVVDGNASELADQPEARLVPTDSELGPPKSPRYESRYDRLAEVNKHAGLSYNYQSSEGPGGGPGGEPFYKRDLGSLLRECRASRKLVILIVAIALLLDNMLLTSVVPIIPSYLFKLRIQRQLEQVGGDPELLLAQRRLNESSAKLGKEGVAASDLMGMTNDQLDELFYHLNKSHSDLSSQWTGSVFNPKLRKPSSKWSTYNNAISDDKDDDDEEEDGTGSDDRERDDDNDDQHDDNGQPAGARGQDATKTNKLGSKSGPRGPSASIGRTSGRSRGQLARRPDRPEEVSQRSQVSDRNKNNNSGRDNQNTGDTDDDNDDNDNNDDDDDDGNDDDDEDRAKQNWVQVRRSLIERARRLNGSESDQSQLGGMCLNLVLGRDDTTSAGNDDDVLDDASQTSDSDGRGTDRKSAGIRRKTRSTKAEVDDENSMRQRKKSKQIVKLRRKQTKSSDPKRKLPPTTLKSKQNADQLADQLPISQQDIVDESFEVGVMFASKPIVQAIANPFIGSLTNKVGFTVPMFTGFVIMFLSTLVFAFGSSYGTLFLARAIQGIGSACTSVAGMSMLADRFPDDAERGNAMAVALGGLALGVVIGPPFGGFMYEFVGKSSPFIVLAILALLDGLLQLAVLQPRLTKSQEEGASLMTLIKDPYILVAAGAITFANTGIAILEPALPLWMMYTMGASNWEQGVAFLPAALSYMFGTNIFGGLGHKIGRWRATMIGLIMIGVSLLLIPFASRVEHLIIPNGAIGFAMGMVDSTMMPMLGYLVDIRHTSVYGSVYAIGDVAFCASFAFGPALSGTLVEIIGFEGLVVTTAFICFAFAPLLFLLRDPPARLVNDPMAAMEDPDDEDPTSIEQQSALRYANFAHLDEMSNEKSAGQNLVR